MNDTYKIGIEEEYFLVDGATKSVTRAMPEAFLTAAKAATNGQVMGEFLQSQLEVRTLPHTDIKTAREELRHLRQTVAKVAAEHGLAILAAGTHPTADWRKSQQSEGERYDAVMDDLQMIGQRNMLCGLHVHVELPHPDDRVDVMTRMLPYLPLFIALGTSSPFWRSRPTGLKGYRLAAYDELPRTGVPELFRNKDEFDAYVDALVKAGVMQDSSYVWWSMRPSLKHPTLGAARARLPDAGRRFDRDRGALSGAGAPADAQPGAQPRHQRGHARDRGRKQVARPALRRARHIRRRERRDHGRRFDGAGDRRGRRRMPPRSAASTRCSAAAPSSAPAPRPTRRWRCSRRTARPKAAPARSTRSPTGSRSRRCSRPFDSPRPAARSAPPGPRARASTTPSPRSAISVSICTASRARCAVLDAGRRKRADQPFEQGADQRRRREPRILLGQMAAVDRGLGCGIQARRRAPCGTRAACDRSPRRPARRSPPRPAGGCAARAWQTSRSRRPAPTAARARRRRRAAPRRSRAPTCARSARRPGPTCPGNSDRPCRRRCRRARRSARSGSRPCRPRLRPRAPPQGSRRGGRRDGGPRSRCGGRPSRERLNSDSSRNASQ